MLADCCCCCCVRRVVRRFEARPQQGRQLAPWLRAVLVQHTAFLMTVPNLLNKLAKLYQVSTATPAHHSTTHTCSTTHHPRTMLPHSLDKWRNIGEYSVRTSTSTRSLFNWNADRKAPASDLLLSETFSFPSPTPHCVALVHSRFRECHSPPLWLCLLVVCRPLMHGCWCSRSFSSCLGDWTWCCHKSPKGENPKSSCFAGRFAYTQCLLVQREASCLSILRGRRL